MPTSLQNSTFLDYNNFRSEEGPYRLDRTANIPTINVALVLERKHDPSELLSQDWGARQQKLQELNAAGTLWDTYGASVDAYNALIDALGQLSDPVQTVDAIEPQNGYVSSAESRTVWVQLSPTQFQELFGTELISIRTPVGPSLAWEGSLTLPWDTSMGVVGVWFDSNAFGNLPPKPGTLPVAPLQPGIQSIGNALSEQQANVLFPNEIAQDYYNFPLSGTLWQTVQTGAIGLLESGLGTAVQSSDPSIAEAIENYRNKVGINPFIEPVITTVANGGQAYSSNGVGERALDFSVVTAINPRSELIFYAGSGSAAGAKHEAYATYQGAIWDTVNSPEVISSSERFALAQPAPNSPFLVAANELFTDAALRNVTVLSSAGDGGSGYQTPSGPPALSISRSSPYALLVGGTSITTNDTSRMERNSDPALRQLLESVTRRDKSALWQLVAGGLTTTANGALGLFLESVWNTYKVTAQIRPDGTTYLVTTFFGNLAGSGGVDPTQPIPSYQQNYGLTPTTSDPAQLTGRGIPDVSALAGGNMRYKVVSSNNMLDTTPNGGTSAATPLWAALISQINAVFADQGLPTLGYMNDLLYIASAIAPPSLQDVTFGNNTSSFQIGDSSSDYVTVNPNNNQHFQIIPTGYGYEAGTGYDLATGLGTPNGLLLARAMTAIAHHQVDFAHANQLLDSDGAGGWTAGADQALLVQVMTGTASSVEVESGGDSFSVESGAADPFAWTSRFAQQVLQEDFSYTLARKFDRQSQGAVSQIETHRGDDFSVAFNGVDATALQGLLSSPYGFADFVTQDGAVRVARPVLVAETAGAADDQTAIVRMRSMVSNALELMLYRVDDLLGRINGIAPGAAGYAAAAEGRAYTTSTGGTSIDNPARGEFGEAQIVGVDAGDIVAMRLEDTTRGRTYWAFSEANEKVDGAGVGHLWNYGLNTYGWETSYHGGDGDYSDLIVQVDFTSASGHGYIA